MARELGDDRLMARAWGRRGLALSGVEGRQEEVERATLEAIRLAEKAGDLDALHIALNNASSHYLHIGNRARSRQYAERKMTVARRLGSPWALAVALADWSDDLYERGDTEGWRSFREQTLEVVQRSELPALRGYLTIPGELLMVEGSTDEACTLFEKCLADGEREGNSLLVEEAQRNLAELHRLEGRLDQARRFYETLLQRPELDAEAKYPTLVPLVAALLEMRTEDGTAEARHYMSDVHVADRSQHPLWFTARMQVAAGWLAAREGSCSEASRLIEESLDILRSNQLVVQEGEVLVCYGLALAELGENKASNERLTEAAELFRRIGHILHLRRAERLQMRVEAGESGNTPPG
jgi:tetratricopeptide (TPR) repeat protein